jgi:hypothetical protein
MKQKHLLVLYGLFLLSFSQGCVTIFSDFQSADTLGKGNTEITPATSKVIIADEGETEHWQNNYGVQLGVGLNDNIDARFRIEIPTIPDESYTFGDVVIFGAGPKFSLSEDIAALYVPIGFAVGKDIETSEFVEIQPTLLFTIPVIQSFEINPSAKLIIPVDSDRSSTYAFNLGLAYWQGKLGVRPEMGFMKSLEDSEGTFYHFGIGFSLRNIDKF